MRILATVLALIASTDAFAWETTSPDAFVTFEGSQELYDGSEYEITVPSGSPIALHLVANATASMGVLEDGWSQLEWPDAKLEHSWQGVPYGGAVSLAVTVELTVEVVIDGSAFGLSYKGTFPLWTESLAWEGSEGFDTLLLPGSPQEQVEVTIEGTDLYRLDESFDVTTDITVNLGGSLTPANHATLRGTGIQTNGMEVSEYDGVAILDKPAKNLGTLPMTSYWKGAIESKLGIDLKPYIEVCVDGLGCLEVDSFEFPWTLVDDAFEFRSDNVSYEHDVPAIVPGRATLDLGTVKPGELAEATLTIGNLGIVALEGEASAEGDGFDVSDDSFFAEGEDETVITVTFLGEDEGTFTGKVVLVSNDPVRDNVEIPVAVRVDDGVDDEPIDDTDTTPGDDENGDGDVETVDGKCGCAAGGSSSVAWLGLLAIFGLRRRASR